MEISMFRKWALIAIMGLGCVLMLSGCGDDCSGLRKQVKKGFGGSCGEAVAQSSILPPASSAVYKDYLYSANWTDGSISAFEVDQATGDLVEIASSPVLSDNGVTSLAVHPDGNFLFAANYSGQSISVFAIDAASGSLSHVPGSPFAAADIRPNDIAINAAGTFLCAAHYDGTGAVSCYAIDQVTGALTNVPGSPFAAGAWTSGVSFDGSGNYVYASNWNDNTISNYSVNASGSLASLGAATASCSASGMTIDPSGNFLYAACDQAVGRHVINPDGSLGAVTNYSTGIDPINGIVRYGFNLVISPDGEKLYSINRNDPGVPGDIAAYTRDVVTGALTLTPNSPYMVGGTAVSIAMDPSGEFLYSGNMGNSDVNGFGIDQITGELSAVPGVSFATGTGTRDLLVVRIAQ